MTDDRERAALALLPAFRFYAVPNPHPEPGYETMLQPLDPEHLLDYLDAHPEAKAALAAWLLQGGAGPATPGPTGATVNETPPAGLPARAAAQPREADPEGPGDPDGLAAASAAAARVRPEADPAPEPREDREGLCPCAGACHHGTHPCSLGCWAAQKPWRVEEAFEEGRAAAHPEPAAGPGETAGLLDVNRLRKAMDSTLSGYIGHSMTDFLAADLAAEYDRLVVTQGPGAP